MGMDDFVNEGVKNGIISLFTGEGSGFNGEADEQADGKKRIIANPNRMDTADRWFSNFPIIVIVLVKDR